MSTSRLSLIVLSSIIPGYGSIAPVTFGGRLFFIFYALFGIPVALVFLSALGDILNRLLNRLIWRLGKKAERPLVKTIVLISFTLVGLCLFIFFPAIIFYAIEPWSYFESVYFGFVSLTTVGFGDFVPTLSQDGSLHGLYRICSAVWIWLGLAFVSLLITRIQDTFTDLRKFLKMCKTKCEKRKQEAVVDDEKAGSAMETMAEDRGAGEHTEREE